MAVAGRDAINSAEFRARPELPSGVDKAKTIDTIIESECRNILARALFQVRAGDRDHQSEGECQMLMLWQDKSSPRW